MFMRLWAVVGLVTGFCLGCGSAPAATAPVDTAAAVTLTKSTPPGILSTTINPESPIRVEIADGCPTTVAGHPDGSSTGAIWTVNTDSTGLEASFVPGTPTGALICRYAALTTTTVAPDGRQLDSGELFTSTTLDADAATTLATTLNDIVPWNFTAGCLFGEQAARYTAIVFALPGRSDVDVWLKDWIGCPEVGNGMRTSGELVNGQGTAFLAQLDADAPPAPPQDFSPTS
jgi:hypothetical protein